MTTKLMMFTGEVIRESLIDPSVLEGFREYLVKTRTATVENFVPPLWHIGRYQLPLEQVLRLIPRLVNNINDGAWYVHFYSETTDEMYVVLSGKSFKLPKHRDASWDEMIAYGEKVGVGRRWTENIPVDFDV
jgi:hypothetical protein